MTESQAGRACATQSDSRAGFERGASAVEYGLLIAGIAMIVVLAIFALGPVTDELFTDTCDELDAQSTVSAGCS
ncbi:hypothetical protein [Nocardioides nanhaiensis]|uniref:Flp family type IVb pilin n=1 Tax=Nocardioides nanhaiensis TaxID=1476871 RepID=A0ABP8WTV6_9ACTN